MAPKLSKTLMFCTVLALSACLFLPFSQPMPFFLELGQRLASGQRIDSFMPVFYPLFLSVGLRVSGVYGIFFLQAAVYLLTVFLAWIWLKKNDVLEQRRWVGVALVALHPYLLFNIKRIVENNLSVPMFLALSIVLLILSTRSLRLRRAAWGGAVFGAAMMVRGNFVALAPVFLWILMNRKSATREEKSQWFIVFFISTVAMLGLISIFTTGRFFWLPMEGVINFFGGANPFTMKTLLSDYNADAAVDRALAYYKIEALDAHANRTLLRLGLHFMWERPHEYFLLIFVKFFTLFRPDYRLVGVSETVGWAGVLFLAQTVMALPLPVWIYMCIKTRRNPFHFPYTGLIVLFYLLPCLLTMADPRYRLPVDVLLILDTCRLALKKR